MVEGTNPQYEPAGACQAPAGSALTSPATVVKKTHALKHTSVDSLSKNLMPINAPYRLTACAVALVERRWQQE